MRSLSTVAVLVLLSAVVLIPWRRRRRRLAPTDGGFWCKVRSRGAPSALWPRLRWRWPRRRMWGRWKDDILVVRHGPLLLRKASLPALVCRDGVYSVPASGGPKRCGRRPIAVELAITDGSRVEVAAPESARSALVGPYLAAAIHDLPQAPVPRRDIPGSGT